MARQGKRVSRTIPVQGYGYPLTDILKEDIVYSKLLKIWQREIGMMDLASVQALQDNHRPIEGDFDRFRHAIWSLAVARKWHLLMVQSLNDRHLETAWRCKRHARSWSKYSREYIKSL